MPVGGIRSASSANDAICWKTGPACTPPPIATLGACSVTATTIPGLSAGAIPMNDRVLPR